MHFQTVPPIAIVITILLSSCGSSEMETLRAVNDSLSRELEARHNMLVTLTDVSNLLDTIESYGSELNVDLYQGVSRENVMKRLQAINEYVKKTTVKLSSVEEKLTVSQNENDAYAMMVHALRDELTIRKDEIHSLEQAVYKYGGENKTLIQTTKLQQDQIREMQNKVNEKQQELSLLQAKVDELIANFEVSEAEAYYARAQAIEEAARRTKLAPHKKRETYKEALELYRKAQSLGKVEAKLNVASLEGKVN